MLPISIRQFVFYLQFLAGWTMFSLTAGFQPTHKVSGMDLLRTCRARLAFRRGFLLADS